MTPNELKDKIQAEGVELAKKYPFYVAEFGTGVGKSLTFIKIMEELGGKWAIVVAETNHIHNWVDEFKKHGKEKLIANITFLCYASLHKHTHHIQYCFDEIHHLLLSVKRLELLEELYKVRKINRFVGLSASLSTRQKGNLNDIVSGVKYHRFSLSNAIDVGLLPEPKVYLIEIELDNTNQTETFNWSKTSIISCSQRKWYDLQSTRINYFRDCFFASGNEFDKRKWLSAGNIRKAFLANIKTPYAKILLNKLKDKRLICFTHSIPQSEELSKGFSIHSNISLELRKSMIEDFNMGRTSKLFTTRMLREGMNLNNIEAGVMIQLDNNTKSFIQPGGRIMRSSAPEFYILYVKNTQDETYLENALEGFNRDYIVETTLNEL